MKTFYIRNYYDDKVIKVYCRSDEEFYYWKRVLSILEDVFCVDIMFGNKEYHDVTEEEMIKYWDILEVERQ